MQEEEEEAAVGEGEAETGAVGPCLVEILQV